MYQNDNYLIVLFLKIKQNEDNEDNDIADNKESASFALS